MRTTSWPVRIAALIAVAVGIGFSPCEQLSLSLGAPHSVTCALLAAAVIVICVLSALTKSAKQWGLCRPQRLCTQHMLRFLPIAAIIAANIVLVCASNYSPTFQLLTLFFVLLVVALEEIAFRGFAIPWFTELARGQVDKAIVLSSVLFGLLHIVNLTQNGLGITLAQVVYATLIGYCLGCLRMECRSVIPGVLIHFLLNITAVNQSLIAITTQLILAAICFACILIFPKVNRN